MTERRQIGRSILAILASFVTIVVLSIGTDAIMHATGIFAPMGQPMSNPLWALATAYRAAYGILGGYIVARLAPSRPMQHAMASAVVGLIISTLGVVLTWDQGPEFGPKWYPISLVVTVVPCAWAGARLRALERQPKLATNSQQT